MVETSSGWRRSATTITRAEQGAKLRNAPCHTSSSNSGQDNRSSRNAGSLRRSPKTSTSVLNYGDESVSVALEEVAAAEWGEKVYRPDIVEKAATLYKKPGYEM